jgi:AraC-like DNA-binding protein
MTPDQISQAAKLIGKMSREDIAAEVGTSVVSLKRAFRGRRLAFYNYCTINPAWVRSVNKYYEKHTQEETAKYFGIRRKQVDHIVHRYKKYRKPKQLRWTPQEIAEAAKMAGLVSENGQAKFFRRPGAHSGSIKSLWMKNFGMGQGSINGMTHWCAKEIVGEKARYLKPLGQTRKGKPTEFRRVILWVDMEKCLKPQTPKFIREAIEQMAKFQRWLWKSENPKPLILKMMRERDAVQQRRIQQKHKTDARVGA